MIHSGNESSFEKAERKKTFPSSALPTSLSKELFQHLSGDIPRLSMPAEEDLCIIERQLGRKPEGQVFIARRCSHGKPAVILTVISASSWRGPLPPFLWLACLHLTREASRLESKGAMRELQKKVDLDEKISSRLAFEEASLYELKKRILRLLGVEGFDSPHRCEGIAGGRRGAVKCLHAHLAFHLAFGEGVIGEECLQMMGKGRCIWCERIPEACVH
ncbi:MAG: DUF501 domain-containing protein [Actinomycetota bacterium]|nr:DUF501 domain-containing protein [Actinomycetota bacterium]